MSHDKKRVLFPYLIKGNAITIAGQYLQYDCEHVSLEEFARYLVENSPNNKKHDIGNGLTAEFKNCIIYIGCREYDKGYLIEKCEHILGIKIDKLVIEGYSFSNVQVENLHNWLIKL